MVFDTGHRPLLAVLVLNQICWSAVEEIVSGLVINLESAGAPSGGVILTELSRAIVVSPEVRFVLLPVFTIGAPLGEVGGGAGGVGGVTIAAGELQNTEVVLTLQPVLRLVKLSNLLFMQPLRATVAIIKANPLT